MNKILIQVSVAELLDKISILEIKKNNISDKKKLLNVNKEYRILKIQLKKKVKFDHKLSQFFKKLKKINSKLWIIEDKKRICEKKKDFGKKFIKLSRDVHFFNDDRAKIKLDINNYSGSDIKEVKEYIKY